MKAGGVPVLVALRTLGLGGVPGGVGRAGTRTRRQRRPGPLAVGDVKGVAVDAGLPMAVGTERRAAYRVSVSLKLGILGADRQVPQADRAVVADRGEHRAVLAESERADRLRVAVQDGAFLGRFDVPEADRTVFARRRER